MYPNERLPAMESACSPNRKRHISPVAVAHTISRRGLAATISYVLYMAAARQCWLIIHDDRGIVRRKSSAMDAPSGIWYDPSFVARTRLPSGTLAFDVQVGASDLQHRVLVFPTRSPLVHAVALKMLRKQCETGWRAITSLKSEEIEAANAFTCHSPPKERNMHLYSFMEQYSDLLEEGLNITSCQNRDDMGIAAPGRIFTTVLNNEMPTDVWHPDGCVYMPRPRDHEFFTVLTYPMPHWDGDASFGGHVEFAAQECGGPAEGDRSSTTAAVLRIVPKFDQVVVFSGPLLHRASHPAAASKSGLRYRAPPTLPLRLSQRYSADAAWRYSAVIQAICQNTPLPPPPPPSALAHLIRTGISYFGSWMRVNGSDWTSAESKEPEMASVRDQEGDDSYSRKGEL